MKTTHSDDFEAREAHSRVDDDAVDDASWIEREHLILQLREANERLVVATMLADELVEEARASRDALSTKVREAQASNRAKDDFLAMLGHELRNSLAPIVLAQDLIALDSEGLHEREHAITSRQVDQLVQLVDELLDIARIKSGKVTLHRKKLELADVVSRAVEIASPLIESKHHTLIVDVAPRGLTVDADVLRLTQVVGNLLTNAAKYTPPNGTLAIRAERRGAQVVLRVRDNGIGISKEMLPRIFDMFAQEQQPGDAAPGGLGLGLAIVRSLVTLHGGTVTANSEGIGRGTEIVIELPAYADKSDAAPPTALALLPVGRSVRRKILLVDDNRLVGDFTGIALEAIGHEVRVAFDGPSALAIVETFAPDVVLVDISLPGMTGYELADRLRARLSPHEVHFIAITGHGQPDDLQRSADEGFDAHLVKPVDLAILQASIAATVGDQGRESRPRA